MALRGVDLEGPPKTPPFDAGGLLDYSSAWSGNATHAIFGFDPEDGSAHVSFAWQAGRNDDKARVFNVYVAQQDDGASGCGFFGYGSPFGDEGPSGNEISTFVCNWAGPGNNHDGKVGFAQKQCMSRTAEGLFEPTSSAISYAPVNDCDSSEDPGFSYKVPGEVDYLTEPLVDELVDLAADADYALYTAPTAPVTP